MAWFFFQIEILLKYPISTKPSFKFGKLESPTKKIHNIMCKLSVFVDINFCLYVFIQDNNYNSNITATQFRTYLTLQKTNLYSSELRYTCKAIFEQFPQLLALVLAEDCVFASLSNQYPINPPNFEIGLQGGCVDEKISSKS